MVLFLYFRALFDGFWTIFCDAPGKVQICGIIFSQIAEIFVKPQKFLPIKMCTIIIKGSTELRSKHPWKSSFISHPPVSEKKQLVSHLHI